MNNLLKPYHQQPKESAEQYKAFVFYKELGNDRTLSKLARQLKVSIETIIRIDLFGGEKEVDVLDRLQIWSKKYRWTERIEIWLSDDIEELNKKEREKFIAFQKNSNIKSFNLTQQLIRIIQTTANEIEQNFKKVTPILNKEGNMIGHNTTYNKLLPELLKMTTAFEKTITMERQCLGLSEGQFAIFTHEESKTIGSYDENKLTKEERITLYELLTKARTI